MNKKKQSFVIPTHGGFSRIKKKKNAAEKAKAQNIKASLARY